MKRFVHGSIRRVGNRLHGKWMPFVLLSRRSARRRLRVGSGKIVSRDTDVDSDGRSVCVGNTEIAQGRNGLFRFRGLADDVGPAALGKHSREALERQGLIVDQINSRFCTGPDGSPGPSESIWETLSAADPRRKAVERG